MIEQIIDEMQASLTKLRGHLRKTEMAGDAMREKEKYQERLWDEMSAIPDFLKGKSGEAKTATETAMEQMSESYDLYSWLNGKTDKKPPIADRILEKLSESPRQCTCVSGVVDGNCPIHGREACMKHLIPDLPLHVRVAKALGWEIGLHSVGWEMLLPVNPPKYENHRRWHPIPDYPNDLVAAWDAFHTYLEQNDLMWKIERTRTGQGYIGLREIHAGWDISKEADKIAMYHLKGETLAENFCEAIVAHAEGKFR